MRVGLGEYWKKRDFERTPEPRGAARPRPAGAPLRFVVQKHAASHLHYDFRLELDGVLLSWAVPKGPSLVPGDKRLAMRTEDHPLDYADFEGVIPAGEYGGGTVLLWDRGRWIPDGDPRRGLERGSLAFVLEGEKLRGGWRLVRSGRDARGKERWLLIKRRDAAADPDGAPIVAASPLSVTTGRDLEQIAGEGDRVWRSNRKGRRVGPRQSPRQSPRPAPAARRLPPGRPGDPGSLPGARRGELPARPGAMLATLAAAPPGGDEWLHEVKLDGYRLLCRLERGRVRLISRRGHDWTARFPGVARALAALPCRAALLDGEAVVLDPRGVSDFQALQNAIGQGRGDIALFAFDLVHLDGFDLSEVPLRARKEALRLLLAGQRDPALRYGDHVVGQGPAFFQQACRVGLEGIVSKRADSHYAPRRGRAWLKVKCIRRQELVIVGFTDPEGTRTGFGALLLAVHDAEGRLVPAGRAGTGFSERTLVALHRRLEALERPTSPLAAGAKGRRARGIHWVEPRLVAEVAFGEWTRDGVIRHASFQGLREDKDPREVRREEPVCAAPAPEPRPAAPPPRRARPGEPTTIGGVRLTHPDRVLWPEQGVTKEELARHYERVADLMLPHVVDRPLTLLRCPGGRHQDCFFQKHANRTVPEAIPRVELPGKGKANLYLAIDGLPALLSLVQMGVLEVHVWGARRDRLDRPDLLVLDLDPAPEVPWAEVADAARTLRARLEGLGLVPFLKATGGKGLHLVVPLRRRSSWDEVKNASHALARELARADPQRFIAQMSRERRKGKIFVDYLRNARNATAIAPYSTRARPGAPVAFPLRWEELDALGGPPILGLRELPARLDALSGDPWEGFEAARRGLTKAILRELGV